MSALILDGKAVAAKIKMQIRQEVEKLKTEGITPTSGDPGGRGSISQIYVRNERNCQSRLHSQTYGLPANISQMNP